MRRTLRIKRRAQMLKRAFSRRPRATHDPPRRRPSRLLGEVMPSPS